MKKPRLMPSPRQMDRHQRIRCQCRTAGSCQCCKRLRRQLEAMYDHILSIYDHIWSMIIYETYMIIYGRRRSPGRSWDDLEESWGDPEGSEGILTESGSILGTSLRSRRRPTYFEENLNYCFAKIIHFAPRIIPGDGLAAELRRSFQKQSFGHNSNLFRLYLHWLPHTKSTMHPEPDLKNPLTSAKSLPVAVCGCL